ncbi:MAG TPA: hypothetical protein VFP89_10060 [Propionibacteriaceae bacterium]|nr:hypothetical protein [Propionibacteriaceae bacterium]
MPKKPDSDSDDQISETQRLDALVDPDGTPADVEVIPDPISAEQVPDGPPRSYGDPRRAGSAEGHADSERD